MASSEHLAVPRRHSLAGPYNRSDDAGRKVREAVVVESARQTGTHGTAIGGASAVYNLVCFWALTQGIHSLANGMHFSRQDSAKQVNWGDWSRALVLSPEPRSTAKN